MRLWFFVAVMIDPKHKDKIGSELITSILREFNAPISTRLLQAEVKKVESQCLASSVIALNVMRITGTIKGKRVDRKWVWWVD